MNNCECDCEKSIKDCPTRTECAQKWYEEYQELLCEQDKQDECIDPNICNSWYDRNKLYLNYYNPYGDSPKKEN